MITLYKINKIREKYDEEFFIKLQNYIYHLDKAQFKK